jgi:hypothetical protein
MTQEPTDNIFIFEGMREGKTFHQTDLHKSQQVNTGLQDTCNYGVTVLEKF